MAANTMARGTKTIKSADGTFQIDVPQDRQNSFPPQIIKKRETILAENLADKIIGLYGLGMAFATLVSHQRRCIDV